MAKFPEIPESEKNPTEVRGQLIKRLTMAGVVVAVLLGVLALFDHLSAPSREQEFKVFTQPVPVAPKKEVTQAVIPTTDLPAPPVAVEPPSVEPPPAPVVASEPVAEEKPVNVEKSSVAAKPVAPVKKEITAAPAVVQKTAPQLVLTKPKVAPSVPHGVPENTAPPVVEMPTEPPVVADEPTAKIVDSKPQPAAAPTKMHRLFSGFLVQAGVFTSPERAEELAERLKVSGVPTTLETRVQVGPFRTRQEAETARAKLKALGVESIVVPPKGEH